MMVQRTATQVCIAALQLLASIPTARAEPKATCGPFAPNVSIAEAEASQPDLGWRVIRHHRTNKIVGAIAERPIQFAGLDWRLSLGDSEGGGWLPYAYNFDLRSDAPSDSVGSCFRQYSQVVSTLEGMYGPFGRHPAFGHDDNVSNSLYGGLGSFDMKPLGRGSLARDYGTGDYTTFFEVDETRGDAVMAEALFSAGQCSLRVNAFHDDDRISRAKASRARYEGNP